MNLGYQMRKIIYLHTMQELIFIVEESTEGGFTAKCTSEPIFTQGDDWETLKKSVVDAVHCHFDDEVKYSFKLV